MAEPYRLVVGADLPQGMTDLALKRLASITLGGPRCGVFLLLSMESKHPLSTIIPAEGLPGVNVLSIDQRGIHFDDTSLQQLDLDIDLPPAEIDIGPLIRTAGHRAVQAQRVEVPFDRVAPAPSEWWQSSSRSSLEVPIGRTGAKKLQSLALGKGTSQHVLVAGKTGSGKSTLLHAVITSAALRYSPRELELYLVDFKKGVEFKCYAQARLPHVRVVAVESDREFGVSVLDRLDQVLKERGEQFRHAGVQDLAGFRDAQPQVVMPRILLVIDEFQEFFTEDDQLAQRASLLFDRLIRQGRAFGVHVILGSQTLAGAYSLARSTLGQVAVRIALQCSDSDAHLILSEENTAARLLSRPGEAIYNDANGLVEGNHPFQVVWLDDSKRDEYLSRAGQLANQQQFALAPPIIFEGHLPGQLQTNHQLMALWNQRATSPQSSRRVVPRMWLGEAAAIRDPLEFRLEPVAGANLLVVGNPAESAAGVIAAMFVDLAAQCPPATHAAGLRCLAVPRDDAPERVSWESLSAIIPELQIGSPQSTRNVLDELFTEFEQRDGQPGTPWLTAFVDLPRFRDLRKADDDYGFGSESRSEMSPAKKFAHLLKEGPSVGLHFAVWCQSYNDVQRWLSRESLQQFEYRVAFQMSANDASALMDDPAANKLGTNRAILWRGDLGTTEKFRPYQFPQPGWGTTAITSSTTVLQSRDLPPSHNLPDVETSPVAPEFSQPIAIPGSASNTSTEPVSQVSHSLATNTVPTIAPPDSDSGGSTILREIAPPQSPTQDPDFWQSLDELSVN